MARSSTASQKKVKKSCKSDEFHRGERVGTKKWVDVFVSIMMGFDWVSRHDL